MTIREKGIRRRWAVVFCLILFAWPRAAATADEPARWIAVVAPGLRAAAEPLIEQRRKQGLQVVVLDPTEVLTAAQLRAGDAAALVEKVRQTWDPEGEPAYVLLVGAPRADDVAQPEKFVVPAPRGTVARMKTQWTDNPYGCVPGEVRARAAVGRFPARTAAEADAMVRKTLAWEAPARPGAWKRRMVLLAGAPSYNEVVDKLVEQLAMANFARLDPLWTGNVVYHNPNSHYTAPNARLNKQAVAYLAEGQMLTLYLGHSNPDGFWHVAEPLEIKNGDGQTITGTVWKPLFSLDDWARLKLPPARGVFATFGCYGAQYAGQDGEGYGLAALRNPDGPVAVIGAHGVCFAAMAMLLAEGLLNAVPGANDAPRVGDIWLKMKKHLADGTINPLTYRALDAVDGDPNIPQAEQRREHQEMFLLLGDPATRFMAFTHEFSLEVAGAAKPGATLTISAAVPPALDGATARLTLERPLTSTPLGLEPLSGELTPAERERRLTENHKRSNQFVLAETTVPVTGRALRAELKLPDALPWKTVMVRAVLATETADGAAVKSVATQKAE